LLNNIRKTEKYEQNNIQIKIHLFVDYRNLFVEAKNILLVEETGVSRENHRPVASH
jgi:hypothetical protein